MKLTALAIALALSTGCPAAAPPGTCGSYGSHHYQNEFPGAYHYDVKPDATSPGGVSVDTSGLSVDLGDLLDRQLEEVDACLADLVPGGKVPDSMRDNCDSPTVPLPIDRECLEVKVAADWIPSKIDGQQMLPAPGPASVCLAKGFCTVESECACHIRSGIQNNRTLVVPPSFYMFKQVLVRIATGCNNVWIQGLEKCSQPTVPALPQ